MSDPANDVNQHNHSSSMSSSLIRIIAVLGAILVIPPFIIAGIILYKNRRKTRKLTPRTPSREVTAPMPQPPKIRHLHLETPSTAPILPAVSTLPTFSIPITTPVYEPIPPIAASPPIRIPSRKTSASNRRSTWRTSHPPFFSISELSQDEIFDNVDLGGPIRGSRIVPTIGSVLVSAESRSARPLTVGRGKRKSWILGSTEDERDVFVFREESDVDGGEFSGSGGDGGHVRSREPERMMKRRKEEIKRGCVEERRIGIGRSEIARSMLVESWV